MSPGINFKLLNTGCPIAHARSIGQNCVLQYVIFYTSRNENNHSTILKYIWITDERTESEGEGEGEVAVFSAKR